MTELTRLDSAKIVATARVLEKRIEERFPESGLAHVCAQLVWLAGKARERSAWIEKPDVRMRALSVSVIAILVIASIAAVVLAAKQGASGGRLGMAELVQVGEAAVNDLVLLGAAIYFLSSLERRAKRARVLRAVQELRTLAHLVDVHQLTKNPDAVRERMTAFEMSRYLDYCSEMLSLIGTIGAVYCDSFDDPDAVEAVTDLEQMAIGLQRKIWQKIVLIEDRARASTGATSRLA